MRAASGRHVTPGTGERRALCSVLSSFTPQHVFRSSCLLATSLQELGFSASFLLKTVNKV